MISRVVFSRQSDLWTTPPDLFAELDAEFHFGLDATATKATALCPQYFGPDHWKPYWRDALVVKWNYVARVAFLNPPYSQCKAFMEKAAQEARRGVTTVCLVPARTDTRWYHAHVWDRTRHRPYPGIQVRCLKGRLKFGGVVTKSGKPTGAPFPSLVVVFWGMDASLQPKRS